MIWVIITKDEVEYGTQPVFCFYEEVFGRDNIKLATVDSCDHLDFISKGDIVVLRTADKTLIERIALFDVKSTAESFLLYELVRDKVVLSDFLRNHGILVPAIHRVDDVVDGHTYFVKPRFGHDSIGITKDNICRSKQEVIAQVQKVREKLNTNELIEDFVDGEEYTVSCVNNGKLLSYALQIDCQEGIQTYEQKYAIKNYCQPVYKTEAITIAERAFCFVGDKALREVRLSQRERRSNLSDRHKPHARSRTLFLLSQKPLTICKYFV